MTNYTKVDKHTCGHTLSMDIYSNWSVWICETCKTKG